MKNPNKLIAIVGGSGAGKSWLSRRLQQELGQMASSLSQDNFYTDRAGLKPCMRALVNYDHPRAIDWPVFEASLRDCRAGKRTQVPKYDFGTHTRLGETQVFSPNAVVLVDGLWLLHRPQVRALFDFSIYLDCPEEVRLERRLARDASERCRESKGIRTQFLKTVLPMHTRFVAPQLFDADIALREFPMDREVENLAETIRALVGENDLPGSAEDLILWPDESIPMNTGRAKVAPEVTLVG